MYSRTVEDACPYTQIPILRTDKASITPLNKNLSFESNKNCDKNPKVRFMPQDHEFDIRFSDGLQLDGAERNSSSLFIRYHFSTNTLFCQ